MRKGPSKYLSSPAAARATPPQIGNNDIQTGSGSVAPRITADRAAAKTGSADLTTLTKLSNKKKDFNLSPSLRYALHWSMKDQSLLSLMQALATCFMLCQHQCSLDVAQESIPDRPKTQGQNGNQVTCPKTTVSRLPVQIQQGHFSRQQLPKKTLPKQWAIETLASAALFDSDGFGTERRPSAHCGTSQIQAKSSCAVPTVAGHGNTFRSCLFAIL